MAEAGLELAAAFLPLPPEYWDHRYMSPYIYWFKNNHTLCIREYAWLEHYATLCNEYSEHSAGGLNHHIV